MKWPYVSRAVYDIVFQAHQEMIAEKQAELQRALDHIVRQQGVIADLQTHNVRMDRKDRGLPEEPREPKPKDDETVPPEVREYLEAFDSLEMRANLEDDMRMARAQGTPWSEIIKMIVVAEDQDVLPEEA